MRVTARRAQCLRAVPALSPLATGGATSANAAASTDMPDDICNRAGNYNLSKLLLAFARQNADMDDTGEKRLRTPNARYFNETYYDDANSGTVIRNQLHEEEAMARANSRAEKRAKAKMSSDDAAQSCRDHMPLSEVVFQIGSDIIKVKESYRYLGVQFFNPAIFAHATTKSLNVRCSIAIRQLKTHLELLADQGQILQVKLLMAQGGIFGTATYGMAMGGVALLGILKDFPCYLNLSAADKADLSRSIARAGGAPDVTILNSVDSMTLGTIAGLESGHHPSNFTMAPMMSDTSMATLHANFGTCPLRLQLIAKLATFVVADENPLLTDESYSPLPLSSKSLAYWMRTLSG